MDGVENRLDVFLGLELVNNGTTWYNAGLKVFILYTRDFVKEGGIVFLGWVQWGHRAKVLMIPQTKLRTWMELKLSRTWSWAP